MHTQPDVLLLPSDLAAWLKVTPASCKVLPPQSTVMSASEPKILSINPGRAVKGASGGTYALVSVAPADSVSSKDAGSIQNVAARSCAEVRRL